jgi:hypothetical protein
MKDLNVERGPMATSKFILPIIFFLLTIAAGFWVSKTGKPYNTALFTLHKLLALSAVVLAVIAIAGLLKTTPTQTLIIVLIGLAVLSAITLFATGALLSIQKSAGSTWLLIHRIAPFVLAGSTFCIIWMLITEKA